jgi:hypothetical protein
MHVPTTTGDSRDVSARRIVDLFALMIGAVRLRISAASDGEQWILTYE